MAHNWRKAPKHGVDALEAEPYTSKFYTLVIAPSEANPDDWELYGIDENFERVYFGDDHDTREDAMAHAAEIDGQVTRER